jgi:rod shape determining protein RodA
LGEEEMNSITWLKRRIRDFDFGILLALLGISIFCTLAIYSATVNRDGMADMYKKEIIWQIVSYCAMFGFVLMDYRSLKSHVAWGGYILSLVLLVAVFIFPAKNGAHSWITLPGFQLQPSEFLKIFLILVISDYMEKIKKRGEPFQAKHFAIVGGLVIVPFLLILKQPALGQALVLLGIAGAMMILFLEKKQLMVFLTVSLLLFIGIFLIKNVYPDQTLQYINHLPMKAYQKERIITFIDPEADPKGIGYQVTQAGIAIGSGQLFGEGLLNGTQTNGAWVPEQWTDFIFSAVAEEFGFVGASVLIFLFFLLLFRMTQLASLTTDYFSCYFIVGVIGMFAFQIFENIGMNLNLMPVAGITLPFISYGGSSLLTNFILVGVVLSIGIRRRKLSF